MATSGSSADAVAPARTASGTATRNRLVAAAYRLVVSRGYHATTMRHIATEAGITAGSIYNHFADKEEIVTEVLLAYHPVMRVLPVLRDVEGRSAAELVRDAAHRMAREIDAAPGVLNLLSIELVELGGRHVPELVTTIQPIVEEFTAQVYASADVVRPADPLVLFRGLMGLLLGYQLTRVATRAGQGDPADLDDFVDMFLHGVLGSAGPAPRQPRSAS